MIDPHVALVVALGVKDLRSRPLSSLKVCHPQVSIDELCVITRSHTIVTDDATYIELLSSTNNNINEVRKIVLASDDNGICNIKEHGNDIVVRTIEDAKTVLQDQNIRDVIVIGNEPLYSMFIEDAEHIYATLFYADFMGDDDGNVFPLQQFGEQFEIDTYGDVCERASDDDGRVLRWRSVSYKRRCRDEKQHNEHVYLDCLRRIIRSQRGDVRDDRTQIGTLSTFGCQWRFDVSSSVPFMTTKQLAWKSVIKELLWFLRGETDSKILEAQGVGIWKGNTTREFLDTRGLNDYREGDLGPLYGFNLRHFGATYEGCNADYRGKGYDQIKVLIDGIKSDPYSRRHMMTTFDPSVVSKSVLAPCHGICIQFYVEKDATSDATRHLSCHVYNRSQDMFLGVPFNIASYAVLLYLIAKLCEDDYITIKPKDLIISTGDTHIYINHIEQVHEQCSRNILPHPKLVVSDSVRTKPLEDITVDDFDIIGYLCHSAIKAPMAV